MIRIPITQVEFDALKNSFITQRLQWDGIYSCNPARDLWHSDHFGYTPPEERIHIKIHNRTLEMIVDLYIYFRPEGGRFFISDQGVYSRVTSTPEQFIAWEWS